jgi:Protein of unknown function, DUF488
VDNRGVYDPLRLGRAVTTAAQPARGTPGAIHRADICLPAQVAELVPCMREPFERALVGSPPVQRSATVMTVQTPQPPPREARWPEGAIFTVGHSTLPIEQFIALLKTYCIERLVDIRTIPRSRHNPQFNSDALGEALHAAGMEYTVLAALGGLRRPRKDSPNMGWRNESFRGYADYMQTGEFEAGLQTLIGMASQRRVAIMCAEAVPWRCHRSLVADALLVRGVPVVEILSETSYRMHTLTPFANVDGARITYPPEQASLL